MHPHDITLKEFARVVGATLTQEVFYYPTNKGLVTMKEGSTCKEKSAKLQIFVYKIINPHNTKKWIMSQEKVTDVDAYLLSPFSNVPPGDCIIIELDAEKEKTEHICESYKIAMEKGELQWQ